MSSAEHTRRDFLYIATGAVGAVGAAAALVPLIAQMNPDASTIAAGAPIEVDLAPIAEGQVIKVFWRGKPIFINHRTKKEIEEARNVNLASLPDPQPDSARVKEGHAKFQVLIGICTHLGCIPLVASGHLQRLVLPLPRLGLRHLRPHPQRPGAETWRCRPTSSSPTPRSGSADPHISSEGSTMSGHSTYQPQSAFMHGWTRRLPIASLVHSSFVAYPTPRNLNYWWTFGGILSFMLAIADHHRHRAGDALHAACRLRLQFGRRHHARRELRLAAALYARQRRVDVLRSPSISTCSAACITAPTRSRARCCGSSASSCCC